MEEKIDESIYWLEIFNEVLSEDLKNETIILEKEGKELLAITVASIITARKNNEKK